MNAVEQLERYAEALDISLKEARRRVRRQNEILDRDGNLTIKTWDDPSSSEPKEHSK